MSRDILGDAGRALREEASGETEEAHATRMRIVGTMRAARRRKVVVARAGVLLLAAALGSTAWAAATGRFPSLPTLTRLLGGLESTGSDPKTGSPESTAPAGPAASGVGSQAPRSSDEDRPAPGEPAPGDVPVPAGDEPAVAAEQPARSGAGQGGGAAADSVPGAPGGSVAGSDRAPGAGTPLNGDRAPGGDNPPLLKETPTASEPAIADKPSPTTSAAAASGAAGTKAPANAATASAGADADALYQRAHALHFQAHDHAAARAAWEAYLRAAPTGRYATLAHYNRALCLVRLGRLEEAKRALQPFASGAAGGYRRAEARALLDALDAKP